MIVMIVVMSGHGKLKKKKCSEMAYLMKVGETCSEGEYQPDQFKSEGK